MRCYDLHSNGCKQPLENEWNFCPECGSMLVKFDWDPDSIEISNQEVETVKANLRIDRGGPVTANISVQPTDASVDKVSVPLSGAQKRIFVEVTLCPANRITLTAECNEVRRMPSDPPFLPNHARVTRQPLRKVLTIYRTSSRAPELRATPELIFAKHGQTSQIRLELLGAEAKCLNFDMPDGWQPTQPLPETIYKDQPVTVAIKPLSGAKEGHLVVKFQENPQTICSVKLNLNVPKQITERCRFVVGIDIGTTGMSITYIDNNLPKSEPQFIGEERVPSAFYMTNPRMPSTWYIGKSYHDRTEREGGVHVQELKRLLVQQEKHVPGTELTPEEILIKFLGKVVKDIIFPQLCSLAVCSERELSIEWRICMPVLADKDDLHYREMLMQVANALQLSTYGEVSIVYEPEAALSTILHHNKESLSVGDRIMIVDSGGGTTDIVIGTINRTPNGLTFSDSVKYPLALPLARNQGLVVSERFFGGGDVTRLCCSKLLQRLNHTNGSDQAPLLEFLAPFQLRGQALDVSKIKTNFFEPFPTSVDRSKYWPYVCPGLVERIEEAKINLSNRLVNGEQKSTDNMTEQVKGKVNLTQQDLQSALELLSNEFLESLDHCLKCESEAGRVQPRWIAFVGGNTIFHELRGDWSHGSRCTELPLDSRTRRLAVPIGLYLQRKVPLLFPGKLRVQFCQDEKQFLLAEYSPDLITECVAASKDFQGETPLHGELLVEMTWLGQSYVLTRALVVSSSSRLRFKVELKHSKVRVVQSDGKVDNEQVVLDIQVL